jgi:hypothetical protein
LTLLRDHWGSGNGLHDVRAVTFDEDRSAVRTAAAPQVCAACRTFAGRPLTAVRLVATAGSTVMK